MAHCTPSFFAGHARNPTRRTATCRVISHAAAGRARSQTRGIPGSSPAIRFSISFHAAAALKAGALASGTALEFAVAEPDFIAWLVGICHLA
jgi:hypothetical protein